MPLDSRQPRVVSTHYNLRPRTHRIAQSSIEVEYFNTYTVKVCSPLSQSLPILYIPYSLHQQKQTFYTISPQYFHIHTPPHSPKHKPINQDIQLIILNHTKTINTNTSTPWQLKLLFLFASWWILLFQFILAILQVCKQAVIRVLQDIYSIDYITTFKTTFIPTLIQTNNAIQNKVITAVTQNVTQPLQQDISTIYTQLHSYLPQLVIVTTFHIIHYTIFTLWAYTQPDLQTIQNTLTIRTLFTLFALIYYVPIQFRQAIQYVIYNITSFVYSHTTFHFSNTHTITNQPNPQIEQTTPKMAPRTRRAASLSPEEEITNSNASPLISNEDISQVVHEHIQSNTDIVAIRHDLDMVHTQLEEIRNALISLTRAQQQTYQQTQQTQQIPQIQPTQPNTDNSLQNPYHPPQTSQNPPPTIPSLHSQQPVIHQSTSTLPEVLIQPTTQPLNLRQLFSKTTHATLTLNEFESFTRIPQDRLTETDTRIFLNRLENYLTQDKNDDELNNEARALRTLSQHISWRTLAQWLQLYANTEVPFSYPREQFWRKKFDDNATRCYYQPPERVDLATVLQRLVDTQNNHHTPYPPKERHTIHNENRRNFNNSPSNVNPIRPTFYRPPPQHPTPFRNSTPSTPNPRFQPQYNNSQHHNNNSNQAPFNYTRPQPPINNSNQMIHSQHNQNYNNLQTHLPNNTHKFSGFH